MANSSAPMDMQKSSDPPKPSKSKRRYGNQIRQLMRFKNKLISLSQEKDDLTNQFKNLESKYQQENRELFTHLRNKNVQIATLAKENTTLAETKNELNKEIKALEQTCAALQTKLEEALATIQTKTKLLLPAETKQEIENQKKILQAQFDQQLLQEKNKLQKELAEMHNQSNLRLSRERDKLYKEIKNISDQNLALQRALAYKEEYVNELTKKIQDADRAQRNLDAATIFTTQQNTSVQSTPVHAPALTRSHPTSAQDWKSVHPPPQQTNFGAVARTPSSPRLFPPAATPQSSQQIAAAPVPVVVQPAPQAPFPQTQLHDPRLFSANPPQANAVIMAAASVPSAAPIPQGGYLLQTSPPPGYAIAILPPKWWLSYPYYSSPG